MSTLHVRESHVQSSLATDWEGKIVTSHHVPVVTLDAAVAHFGIPDYCKVDVEGWELEVLKGLSCGFPLLSLEFHLTGPDIVKTKACLDLLERFGPSWVNVAPAERPQFHLDRWIPLAEFRAGFPGGLNASLPGAHYGDLFIKREANQRL